MGSIFYLDRSDIIAIFLYSNRPDNNYNTITTTTTVTQKNNERPFVTVKRAHEQARGNNIIGVSLVQQKKKEVRTRS